MGEQKLSSMKFNQEKYKEKKKEEENDPGERKSHRRRSQSEQCQGGGRGCLGGQKGPANWGKRKPGTWAASLSGPAKKKETFTAAKEKSRGGGASSVREKIHVRACLAQVKKKRAISPAFIFSGWGDKDV